MGGYWYKENYSEPLSISFIDCDNFGDLSGVGYVAMLIGNPTNINSYRDNVSVENTYNYGNISGGRSAALFSQYDAKDDDNIRELFLELSWCISLYDYF